ncbi:hypothetical protein BKA70DRAFT_1431097 [Coprinopsis sp. MPI-PUGE-AT-0042]|nr:hypothetical protein BKA70DRAFT_1431097 [Coprinopsis sp. MPI-PUGE-AT-0042]
MADWLEYVTLPSEYRSSPGGSADTEAADRTMLARWLVSTDGCTDSNSLPDPELPQGTDFDDHWPRLLYQNFEFDQANTWEGFLMNGILVKALTGILLQAFKLIFRRDAISNVHLSSMTEVTRASIAYVATLVIVVILGFDQPLNWSNRSWRLSLPPFHILEDFFNNFIAI